MHYTGTPSSYAPCKRADYNSSSFMYAGLRSMATNATVFQQNRTHHFQSLFSIKITKNDRVPCSLEVAVHFYVFFRTPSHTPVGL